MENSSLNTYKIVRKLGEGGGGIVYLAYHTRLQKQVVLKEIKNSHKIKNCRREVDILKGLHHTYLPEVYDFIEIDGHLYTVMSYIPGKSFQQLVQEGHRFKQSQLRRWGVQLCSALDYLHNQKPPIIHSDIKPANIMLTPQGNICLIDFNISFFLDGTAIVGYTHGYSSPEQKSIAFHENKEGIVVDDKTDIYSVGAVFYYLITGEKINYENNDLINRELLEKKVSQSFANIIYRAIAYKKEDRFQSANEMLKAFRQIPQNDKRYQKVVKMHKISMITAGSLLVVSIVLGGLGIHELKLEKVEKYNSLVQQQINYRQKKNYKKEEKAYKEAIKIIPDSLESYYQNALAIYEKGDYQECLDFISYDIELNEKVNMLQKGNADVMYVKACSYFELGNYKQAIKSYEQLFRYGSSNYLHYRDYAITLAYNNDEIKANQILQKAIDKGMKEDSIYFAKGEINKAMDRMDDAINYFQLCLDKTDDNNLKERSYVLTSDIYKNQNDLTKCREILINAVNTLPGDKQLISIERLIQVDIDLASKMNDSSYQKEAIELLNKVISNHWDNYKTYDNLVILNEKLGNYSQVNKYLNYMKKTYGDDYNINKRHAFLEIDLQKEKSNEERDYKLFYVYYKKAKVLYEKEEQNDSEMQLLDDVYHQVEKGGWLE